MLRETLLFLSRQQRLGDALTSVAVGRRIARRFVAGQTLDEAIPAVRALNARGVRASLDHLGESVETVEESQAAAEVYPEVLDRIAAEGVDSNVSLKLTQMGLDVDRDRCRDNLQRILGRARERANFVRVDMEDSGHTQVTLDLVTDLHREFANVGVVIQSYLYRSRADVEALIAQGVRVRLCKGAYAEPPTVAFPKKADVDRSFAELAELLLERGDYPAIATHDERLIARTISYVKRRGISPAGFEFQMLYGIRRDLQDQLARDGYNLRAYVPFGSQWYPYFMRRLAERPANLVFLLSNLFRG